MQGVSSPWLPVVKQNPDCNWDFRVCRYRKMLRVTRRLPRGSCMFALSSLPAHRIPNRNLGGYVRGYGWSLVVPLGHHTGNYFGCNQGSASPQARMCPQDHPHHDLTLSLNKG